jgi:hypothetical protein
MKVEVTCQKSIKPLCNPSKASGFKDRMLVARQAAIFRVQDLSPRVRGRRFQGRGSLQLDGATHEAQGNSQQPGDRRFDCMLPLDIFQHSQHNRHYHITISCQRSLRGFQVLVNGNILGILCTITGNDLERDRKIWSDNVTTSGDTEYDL